jgi:hypothetical protein
MWYDRSLVDEAANRRILQWLVIGSSNPLCSTCPWYGLQNCGTEAILPTAFEVYSALCHLSPHSAGHRQMNSKVETPEGVQLLRQLACLMLRDRQSRVSGYNAHMECSSTDIG